MSVPQRARRPRVPAPRHAGPGWPTVTADADARARALTAKAAHENFPVAPRFLPRVWRRDLMAVYGFARLVDDIGDGDLPPGEVDARLLGLDPGQGQDRPALLDAVEQDLRRVFGTGEPRHPALRALVPTVRHHRLSPEPFEALVAANRQDQRVLRYAAWRDLLGYCELSANPVGRLVLAVTGATGREQARRSDAVCTALQVVEHLQDVAEDLARGRIYLPAADMRLFAVTEDDLAAPSAGDALRSLLAYETDRAQALLEEGIPLVAGVPGRLKILLAGFVGGGRAAVGALRAADYDVLAGRPRASRLSVLREAALTLRGEGT